MTWLTYNTSLFDHEMHIRLEDIVGVEIYEMDGVNYGIMVHFSGGKSLDVGSTKGIKLAKEQAEEIKAAVDKAKGSPGRDVYFESKA